MDNYRDTIISQYAASPTMVQLITNMNTYLDPTADLDAFYNDVWNIETASGYGLDIWGRIVGVGRVLHVAAGTYFGFKGTVSASGVGFGQAPFFKTGGGLTSNFELTDNAYRTLILAKALANISNATIPAINQLLINLFGPNGLIPLKGNSYCTDGQNMTMTYTFNSLLDPVATAIVFQSNVLPRPCGVAASVNIVPPSPVTHFTAALTDFAVPTDAFVSAFRGLQDVVSTSDAFVAIPNFLTDVVFTADVFRVTSTATTMTLWTPAQSSANQAFTFNGTYTGNQPEGIEYSFNGGSTYTLATTANTHINGATQTISLTFPAGVSAGTYAIGQLKMRDVNNHAAVGTAAGKWQVLAYVPATPSAGTFIFGTKIADPAYITVDANGPYQLFDFNNSGMHLSRGPTTPKGVLDGTFTGANYPTLRRLDGADSGQTLLGLTPTISAPGLDNSSNFFDAGPLGGPNDLLIQALDTTNVTTGSWVMSYACYVDTTVPGHFSCGPIWGNWLGPNNIIYVSARWNNGAFTGQINLHGAGSTGGTTGDGNFYNLQNLTTSGFHVFTTQKINNLLQWRMDKGAWHATPTLVTTGMSSPAFTSTNMSYSGSFTLGNPGVQSGNAFPREGDFMVYAGVPAAGDISSMETWLGNPIGLSI